MQRGEAVSVGAVGTGWARDTANRATVLVLLAAFIGAVYVVVVFGLGEALDAQPPNTALSVVATSIAALSFGRVRRRAQRIANRLTYGQRATPEEVLSRFTEEVTSSYAPDEALPRMARTIAEGLGATRAEVWVRLDDELLFAADWPRTERRWRARVPLGGSSLPAFDDADRVVAVRHDDELLGAITITKRSGEAVTASEENLLGDVASQAGLVMRNVRLTAELAARLTDIEDTAAELRASRQRIVAAQDSERRRIERDIHDGAQQHLVALAVKLRMARVSIERNPDDAGTTLSDVRGVIGMALEELRDLARGIYPPLLSEQGIVAALQAQAKSASVRATVKAEGVERMAPAVEAAVYFCCLEAMQNAAKHGARTVTITIEQSDDGVSFAVADDGPGFEPYAVVRGSGLTNMEDRIAAAGGRLTIRSAPSSGTTIAGTLPASPREGGA